jgi:hypothetical protein
MVLKTKNPTQGGVGGTGVKAQEYAEGVLPAAMLAPGDRIPLAHFASDGEAS